MNFEIMSYIGVGDIKLGMKREEIRKLFNYRFTEFMKSPLCMRTTDDFGCCHVFYNEQDTCEAIELFIESNVTFEGRSIIGKLYNEVKTMFEAIDNSLDFDDAGFVSYKYGIGVFAPFADEPDGLVESVIVFEKGYFD